MHAQLLESAALDMEWSPHQANILCVATSTGSLLFYTLDPAVGNLIFTSCKQITDESTLVLDILWHPKRDDVIAVTLSDGSTCVCRSSSFWDEHSSVSVTAIASHELEPWTLAFSPDCRNVYSGGDDAVLKCTSLSLSEPGEVETASPVWFDRKIHQAGVTAILPLTNELLVTGSYDDHIRLFSGPTVGRRQVLAELNLGGGVWRLKLMDRDVTAEPGKVFDRYVTQPRKLKSALLPADLTRIAARRDTHVSAHCPRYHTRGSPLLRPRSHTYPPASQKRLHAQ